MAWTRFIPSVILCAGLLAAPGPARAETEPANVAAILAAMRQASGGDQWATVKSLHSLVTLTSGGQSARQERWEDVATGRFASHSTRPTFEGGEGFDGITSWHLGRSGIAYSLGDVDAALVAADESFRVARGWWFPDRHAATITLSGDRSESGRSFDVLEITPEGGRPFQAWIDRASHLLDRTIEQQAEDLVVTRYSDYRMVNGVSLPFTIRTGDGSDPSFDEVATVETVEVNPTIRDSQYAIPPRPPSDVSLPPGQDSVAVPFRLTADNRILVPLSLDGRRTVEAEFDSGGSLILQPATVAALDLNAQGRSKQSGGGEGTSVATNGRIDRVGLGAASVRDLPFHSFMFRPDAPDAALVGLEILQRFVVRFDFDRQVMTLTRPERFAYRGHGAVIPFHFQDNQPEIKGAIDGVAGLFAIDTGDNSSLLLIAPFARRYGLVDRYHADLPYGGTAIGATHGVWARTRAGTVTFDGPDGRALAEVHDPITRISLQQGGFDANRDVSANIGLGILKQFNLTFDYRRQQLILEPNHLYGQKDVFNRAGLRVERQGAAWKVTVIYPGTPASDADIKPGDIVTRINGRSAEQLSMEALRALTLGAVGSHLELDVQAPSADRHVTLVLRELL